MNKQPERPQPYIGISGVISPEQQYYFKERFMAHGLDDLGRKLALGVKAVHKTQWLDIENKYGSDWYPVGKAAFAEALVNDDTGSLRVAQVCLDEEMMANESRGDLPHYSYHDAFTDRICQRGRAWLSALQFDMLPITGVGDDTSGMLPWLERVKHRTGHTILLQAHGKSMAEFGPKKLTEKLCRHASGLDYVLFDASHGKGVAMNPEALKPFLYEAYNSEALNGVGFAVAGGLNADVVRGELTKLVTQYPGVSWDAEGQLHPVRSDGSGRPLDTERVEAYLVASAEVLKQV